MLHLKGYVGRPLKRFEDPRLVTGRGRYVADLEVPGCREVAFVRSPLAHSLVGEIDTSAAEKVDGVVTVLTAASLPAHATLVDSVVVDGLLKTPQPTLATDRCRFVGEPVAMVVARDRYIAEDAAGLVGVDYEMLPTVVTVSTAEQESAPLLFPDLGTNVVYRSTKRFGDPDRFFGEADRIYRSTFEGNRLSASPLETRGCMADYDEGRRELTVWSSTQGQHLLRRRLATTTGLGESSIRVIAPDVGGGFGQKIPAAPEEVAVALAAILLGRPVRWVEDRRENLTAAPHAKQQTVHTEIAVAEDGTFLAMRSRVIGDAGAYSFNAASALIEPYLSATLMPSVYRFEHFETEIVAVLTNKSPVSPYRGVGWTASHTARELLIDRVAADLGRDPADLRRQNMVPSDAFPYEACNGMVFDSGSFQESLEEALSAIDYDAFRLQQAAERSAGRLIGVGISPYVEPGGWGTKGAAQSHWSFASYDSARVTVDSSGDAVVAVGTPSQGQGHHTVLAQVAAEILGIEPGRIRVRNDDTTATPLSGAGTRASRTAVVSGGAVMLAADEVKTQLQRVAGFLLEAPEDDIVLGNGSAHVAGDPDRTVTIARVAAAAHFDPAVRQVHPEPYLSAQRFYDPGPSYSNGCIAATVSVDADTGVVSVLAIVAVEDCGRMINPMIVDGQLRGAVAQGIGYALLEEIVYDGDGQILTGTLMDYLLPTSLDAPRIAVRHLESPSPNTIGGMKGMGESGMIAAPAAIANAVADAIPGHARVEQLPLSPEYVASLLDAASEPAP